MSIEKVLYTAHAKATGGRDGRAVTSDGALDVKLVRPRELGGLGGRARTLSSYLRPATQPALSER